MFYKKISIHRAMSKSAPNVAKALKKVLNHGRIPKNFQARRSTKNHRKI